MMRYSPMIALFALTLAACSKDPPAAGADPTPTTATPSTATSATAAPPASSAVAATPPPTASAAPAGPAAPSSPEPSLKEWDATGCMARRVREWVRVGCSAPSSKNGAPIEIKVVKGFPDTKLSILKERGGSTMLVFPATPGLSGAAVFEFAEGSFQFTASWPAGQPEPKTIGAFEKVDAPAEAQGADPGSAEPAAPSPAGGNDMELVLPEEPAIEGAPAFAEWKAAREVGVKGSSAVGCETKQINDWFRMVCRANEKTGKVTAGTAVRGIETGKGYLVTGNGQLVLLTKFVKGTDTAIDITWESKSAQLLLKWPETAATAPSPRGEFVTKS